MKFWKSSLLTVFAFLGIASTVLYNACQIDTCSDLKCIHGGSCANGFCNCPTGYEGSQCESQVNTKFLGIYNGNTNCDLNPSVYDTAVIVAQPNSLTALKIVLFSNKMDTLTGTINGTSVTVPDINDGSGYSRHISITLVNNSKLTVFTEITSKDLKGNTVKSTCNFIGIKQP